MTLCKCGCGKEIIIKPYHKWYKIPEYIWGHIHRRLYPSIPDLCWCGCGQIVYGGKRFIRGHSNWNSEVILKISKSLSGKNNPMYGKNGKLSPTYGIRKFGSDNPNYGNHLSEENKRIISEAQKGNKYSLNRKCSEETRNKIRGNNNPAKRPEVRKKMSENHADFSGDKAPNWQGGISFEPYCPKFNYQKREEIRNQYQRKCYACNKDEKDNITQNGKLWKLSVHHIDFDKEQGCNGKKFILVPLCLNCHNKIHNCILNLIFI